MNRDQREKQARRARSTRARAATTETTTERPRARYLARSSAGMMQMTQVQIDRNKKESDHG